MSIKKASLQVGPFPWITPAAGGVVARKERKSTRKPHFLECENSLIKAIEGKMHRTKKKRER